MRNPFIRLGLKIPVPGACRWFRRHRYRVDPNVKQILEDTRTGLELRLAECERCHKARLVWVEAKGVQR